MRGYFFAYFLEIDMALRDPLVPQPHLYLTDTSGRPLDGGKVYFGQPNKDPEFYPIDVFYDDALTIAADQPVRTKNGFMTVGGNNIRVYASEYQYSIKVLDSYGRQVFYQALLDSSNADLEKVKFDTGITVLASAVGAINRTLHDKLKDTVSVKDFGAKGDGVTDDTAAIQKAIDYICTKGGTLHGDGSKYAISNTLIIPQNTLAPTFKTAKAVKLDFGDSVFKMLADVTLFQSSNWGTARDSAYSFGITLTNFGIESAVGDLTAPSLQIQDWHQRCEITNISSQVSKTVMIADNCYYTKFDNINTGLVADKANWSGTRFIWRGDTNLCQVSRLVAVNSDTGYQFEDAVTALVMRDMSFEGMNIGTKFDSSVYDLSVTDSYMEAIYDVMFQFNSYVYSATFSNNYINLLNEPTAYFLQYAPLPATNITIDESNHFISMVSDRNIIKNKENIYGHGIVIKKQPAPFSSDINDFMVNKAHFGANIRVQQRVGVAGVTANVTNGNIAGNYSGRFSDGYDRANGFKVLTDNPRLVRLQTKIVNSLVQIVYINIRVSLVGGTAVIYKGFMLGSSFYDFNGDAGVVPSGKIVSIALSDATILLEGGVYEAANILDITGEVRLI